MDRLFQPFLVRSAVSYMHVGFSSVPLTPIPSLGAVGVNLAGAAQLGEGTGQLFGICPNDNDCHSRDVATLCAFSSSSIRSKDRAQQMNNEVQ